MQQQPNRRPKDNSDKAKQSGKASSKFRIRSKKNTRPGYQYGGPTGGNNLPGIGKIQTKTN